MSMRIAIVDDKTSNRNILKNKLLRHGLFEVCLTAGDGKEFLEKMEQTQAEKLPSVVLMDLEMPLMDGVDTIAAGSLLYPAVKFIVLTIFDDEEKIFNAIKAGAFGYLLKDESAENICDMLVQMQENGAGPISPGIAFKMLQLMQNNVMSLPGNTVNAEKNGFNLTDREKEILSLLVQGLMYKEIGAALGISPNTAKRHIMSVYEKLHVNSRAQVINLAHKKKWV